MQGILRVQTWCGLGSSSNGDVSPTITESAGVGGIKPPSSQEPNFFLRTSQDETNTTITFEDYGIGVMKNEVVHNNETITKFGTEVFTEAMSIGGDVNKIEHIGGCSYLAYLVSDKVRVDSKNTDEEQYV